MAKETSKSRKIRLYQGKFSPAAHLRYLNAAALKRVKKTVIEIGSLSVGGRIIPVAAEVHKGQVVALRPSSCKGCNSEGRDSRIGTARAAAIKVALRRARESKRPSARLPMPVARLIRAQRGSGDIDGLDVFCYFWNCCIWVEYTDGWSCAYCLRGPGICIGPVVIVE